MQFQRLAGVKAEVVDVGTDAGTGTFVHPQPLGIGDRFHTNGRFRSGKLNWPVSICPTSALIGYWVCEKRWVDMGPFAASDVSCERGSRLRSPRRRRDAYMQEAACRHSRSAIYCSGLVESCKIEKKYKRGIKITN